MDGHKRHAKYISYSANGFRSTLQDYRQHDGRGKKMVLQQQHFIPFFEKNNIPNIDKPQLA